MPIGIRYFGSTKPGPGVTPIKVVDKVKNPFGKKNYPINWMTGKHLALGDEDTGNGNGSSSAELPTFPFHYDETTKVLTPGVCYINGIATTITSLPASIATPASTTCYYVRIKHSDKTAAWTSGTTFPDQADGFAIVPVLKIVVAVGVEVEQRRWDDIVYVVPPANGVTEGQLCEWNATDKRWEPSAAPDSTGQVAYWNATTKTWTMAGAPSANGQLMVWNGSAWAVVSVAGIASGDLLQWNGSAWVKVTPVSVTVVTDYQYDVSSHYLQKKTRSVTVIASGSESAWTNVTNGDTVPET
jgi:hypothetical protein